MRTSFICKSSEEPIEPLKCFVCAVGVAPPCEWSSSVAGLDWAWGGALAGGGAAALRQPKEISKQNRIIDVRLFIRVLHPQKSAAKSPSEFLKTSVHKAFRH